MSEPAVHTSPLTWDETKTTTCYMCACRCGIKVYLKDGRVKYIEGNRDHPVNKGVICGKGAAGIMQHTAPSRLRAPLKRVGSRDDPGAQRDLLAAQLLRVARAVPALRVAVAEADGDRPVSGREHRHLRRPRAIVVHRAVDEQQRRSAVAFLHVRDLQSLAPERALLDLGARERITGFTFGKAQSFYDIFPRPRFSYFSPANSFTGVRRLSGQRWIPQCRKGFPSALSWADIRR